MATAEMTASPRSGVATRPELTSAQQRVILEATGELVRAAVMNRAATIADATLAGAADMPVSGVFVSLKRGGHLRSCCGMLTGSIPLGRAIEDAAFRTAREDNRFPAVSPTEIGHLDLEVWILYQPEPVAAQGEDRIKAVTIGKHGLQVVRGQSRGLLLPGVAVENEWDSERFLDQVCIKAGLPPTAWRDADTALFTFEGDAIHGRVEVNGAAAAARPAAIFSPEETAAYADFCRGNILALLTGATPNYYFFGAPDCNVGGVVVTVRRGPDAEPLALAQISMRPGVPLQSTLFNLAQSAAQSLARTGIRAEELSALELALAILYDPAMHGTVAGVDTAGIDAAHRAVLVIERNRTGLLFARGEKPADLVAETAKLAQVRNPAAASVFSLEALSTADRIEFSTVPQPVRGPADRPPGVAGTFYPSDAGELTKLVDDLLAGDGEKPKAWPAAMIPHAGLKYSGRIAAAVLKRLKFPKTILVIGPKHTPLGVDWSVAPHQTWQLPTGDIASDPALARKLCQAIPGLELDAAAHSREHAIEVELPFIQRLAPKSKVVGIAIGSGDLEGCRRFAAGLVELFREKKDRPLLLISSDMNHFATDAENRRLDEIAIAAMETLDAEKLLSTCRSNNISMCGVLPAVIVMETLRQLDGLQKCERVGYATSADVTGDASRVVGYAGMLLGCEVVRSRVGRVCGGPPRVDLRFQI